MRDGDDRAGILGQVPLQPVHALGVEMVRRLVEQQQVGLVAAAACTGRRAAARRRRASSTSASPGGQVHRVHRDFQLAVELPGAGRLDLVLHPGHLVAQLLHLVVVHRLGQSGALISL